LKIEKLTRAVVVELIDGIEVSEVVGTGEKGYNITIHYKFGISKTQKEIEPTAKSSSISVRQTTKQ
jgi:hypothetical protein